MAVRNKNYTYYNYSIIDKGKIHSDVVAIAKRIGYAPDACTGASIKGEF